MKILKRIGYGLAILVGLVVVIAGGVYALSTWQYGATYAVQPAEVAVPDDSVAIARGRHIAITRGCADCHGEALAGTTFVDDPVVGRFTGSNLTAGRGGIGGDYTDADWVRALRHGVGPDGKPLVFMPSYEYYYLSDEDVGALIAYLKQLPPVDREVPPPAPGPVARTLMVLGNEGLQLAADRIDHDAPRPKVPSPGPTVAYGEYMARSCMGCHGTDFAGGAIAGAPPDWPEAANLTPHPEAGLGSWSERDFFRALREQRRPDGTALDPVMPAAMGQMTDTELTALWKYLQSLPPTAK